MAHDNTTDLRDRPTRDLDELFGALAHSWRRTAIATLEESGSLDLEALAETIAEEKESYSVRDAKLELVHRHLPRLADADIIAYDTADRSCELDDDGVLDVLSAARNLG